MAEFFHIYIAPKGEVTRKEVENKLNLAVDWFRYADGLYIVYTSSDVDRWKRRLINFVKPEGSLFICKIDISQRQGWMSQDFWRWIKGKQQ